MDSLNPYAPPSSDGNAVQGPPATSGRRRWSGRLCLAGIAVFLLNLPIPLLWGWDLVEQHGIWGMLAAVFVMFVGGGWACARYRKFGFPLIVGGALVALSQLLPVLQFIAGVLALDIGEKLGQTEAISVPY